jgi:hypothetical protein
MKIPQRFINFGLYASFLLITLFPEYSHAHSWMAPKDEAQKPNPIEPTTKSIEIGKELFKENCASCHGEQAKGLPAEKSGLDHDTPNLIQRLKNHSDGDFHWKLKKGKMKCPLLKTISQTTKTGILLII